MLVMPSRFALFNSTDVWWPESRADVLGFLGSAPVVTVRQCDRVVAGELARFAFRTKPSPTAVVDLRAPEAELWQRLDPKSCRYEIRKARELDTRVGLNDRHDEALELLNAHIRRTRYSHELSGQSWLKVLEHADVFVIADDRAPLAAHVILLDPPRARLLMSATIDRSERTRAQIAGRLNRLLHWHELLHYKELGFSFYDFGGVELDRSSSLYPISQFKLSFGGEVVDEFTLRLARLALLRHVLRAATKLRLGVNRLRRARAS